ncbi:MAG: universal stress protein [Candidatus Nitrosocosmicus sp.]
MIEDPDTMVFGNKKDHIEKAKMMNLRITSVNKLPKWAENKIKNLSEQKIGSESICVTEKVVKKISEYAKARKVNMVVMDSSNRLTEILKIKDLGSITRNVSELAGCLVLIAHHKVHFII